MSPLAAFSEPTRTWFAENLGQPTPPQALGWPAIQRGEHTLILSPTGSGKTLAAFLWAIDQLFAEVAAGAAPKGVRLLYISPLKALNNDIERNLRQPLEGVRATAHRLGQPLPELRVAVRTGDTPTRVRLAMLRKPPHILITTPESLYLILSSARARELFRPVRTVIVDEIHTIAGNKRGVHLSLSLERLAHLAADPIQRIGLSATQRPLAEIARYLGGQEWQTVADGSRHLTPRPVTIIDAGMAKPLDLKVVTVVPDFRDLGGSIWPTIEAQVADLIRVHHTTLVFANGRRLAERLAAHLSDHLPFRVRAHHGSTAAAARLEMEADLKEGRLPVLVGTSSLELGIDIGSVDLVVQIQSPKGVARGLQRVGRSGHLVGQTSVGRIFATHREDLMEAATIAGCMLRGEVEHTRVPENCLDVLAQQIVSAVGVESWPAAALYDLVRQSYPYRALPRSAFDEVLAMLAGKYPREVHRELRPRLDWDRVSDRLNALPGSAFLATTNGGTIADRGVYAVYTADRNVKIGELDEEFVYERRVGDVFNLGSQAWRIEHIGEDRVTVSDGSYSLPMTPFWRGDIPWRTYEVGVEVGHFRRQVAERLDDPSALDWLRRDHALDEYSAQNVLRYVRDQIEATGAISSDRTIVAELFRDPLGEPRLVLHSPFGGRINSAWALALQGVFRERLHTTPETLSNDDGILFRFPESDQPPPLDLILRLTPEEARERILLELPDSPLFGAQFRQNAARALLMPRARRGRRTPFWLQRLRAKNLLAATRQFPSFPIIVETYRDCLRDQLDLEHLLEILARIQHSEIQIVPVERATPSPVAAGLLSQFTAIYMYEWDAPKPERQMRTLAIDRDLLGELVQETSLADMLRPEALAALEADLQHTSPGRRARSAAELLLILQELGDLSTDELLARAGEQGPTWIEALAAQGRILQRTIPTAAGPVHRWILAEEASLYDQAIPPHQWIEGPGVRATSPSPYEGEGLGEGRLYADTQDTPLEQSPLTLPSPLAGERATPSLPQSEEAEVRAIPPLPTVGEGPGVRAIPPLPTVGEGPGVRAVLPLPTVGEGPGVRAVPPLPIVGEGPGVRAIPPLPTVGEGPGVRAVPPLPSRGEGRVRGDSHNSTPTGSPSQAEKVRVLLSRLLATHGPMTLDQIRARYALPEDTLRDALQQWVAEHHGIQGRLLPGRSDLQYCDRHNLEQAHRRTLVILRGEIQPVSISDYVDFLARWQHAHPRAQCTASDSLRHILQQLRGLPAPALLWQRDLLPARIAGFRPADLEAPCQSGEVAWVCSGQGRPSHLRARLLFRGEGACYLPPPPTAGHLADLSTAAQKVLALLRSEGACFTADLERGTSLRGEALVQALLELVSAGLVTNDSLHALQELVHFRPSNEIRRPLSTLEAQLAARWTGPHPPRRASRVREARRLVSRHLRAAPQWGGRWSLVHRPGIWGHDLPPEERVARQARQILARYGIVSRDCLAREDQHWAWGALYDHLQRLEMRGEVRRGYFVEGLSGAQFALPEAVERLRERRTASSEEEPPIVLSAWDPALFPVARLLAGLRLPDGTPLAPPRRPSSYCVLQHGRPLLWLERYGRAILAPGGIEEKELLEALRAAFHAITTRTGRRRLTIETWNSIPALGSAAQPLLEAAGCYPHAPLLEWTS